MTTACEPAKGSIDRNVEEFLSWLMAERGRSSNTLNAYRGDLRQFEEWLAQNGQSLLTADSSDVDRYAGVLAQNLAASTVARKMTAVRTFFRFLFVEGIRPDDPAADFEGVKVPSGIPKPLSEEEVERLLSSVAGDDPIAQRDRALLEVLYATGARISEVCGLDRSDVDQESGLVRLYGKGSKERVVPLGSIAGRALRMWLEEGREIVATSARSQRSDSNAVFIDKRGSRLKRQAAWAVVARHAERAGLRERMSPHVLRHSCATHMLDHGADLRIVQEMLGHASISTTQVYTRVSQEHLVAEYRKAHPRSRVSRGS